MNAWIRVKDELPPNGEIVDTKADDTGTERNKRRMIRVEESWFIVAGGGDRANYVPSHWRKARGEGE